mgnify:CR=1 FL=1
MDISTNIPVPKELSFTGNISRNWKVFEEDFRIFWKANLKRKDPDEVCAYLLNFAGREARRREASFVYKEEEKDEEGEKNKKKDRTSRRLASFLDY